MYELVIIGGGPGGVAAGVYAARKKINAAVIADSFGGQSITSADIQNWIGTKSISGLDLAKMLEEHLRSQKGIDVIEDKVSGVKEDSGSFLLTTDGGRTVEAKNILVASGSRRKKLGVPGEKRFDGKGVVYCSTCDAPIFENKVVAVVGGGNSGLEAVNDLLLYAAKVYLLEHGDFLKGDAVTQEKIKANPKVEIITNAETVEILGNEFVSGLRYKDRKSGIIKELALQGVFVEIGAMPNSEFVKELVVLNKLGEIVVDHATQRTSNQHIWAVGDVSDVRYKQNNISAGDAIKAVLNIEESLRK